MGRNIEMIARFLILLAGFFPAAGFAADGRPVTIQQFEKAGGQALPLGKAYGLDGWAVIDAKGQAQYVYTTSDGATLVGLLFAPDGTLETERQIRAYQEKNPAGVPKKSERLYAETEKADWVKLGDDAAPVVYAFMNTSCDHCKKFWKDLEPFVAAGKIQLRLIPFGSIAVNRDGGAMLLSASDPARVWQGLMSDTKKSEIKQESYVRVDKNTEIVKRWKLAGVPFLLYRRASDGVILAVSGSPKDITLFVSEVTKAAP